MSYHFYRKVGLASVEATYVWKASTKFGITKECFSVTQNGKDLNIDISKIIIFKTTHYDINRTQYKESFTWTDQGTTERAFRKDMPFATRDAFNSRLSDERKQEIMNYAKESLGEFIETFVGKKKVNINISVKNNFVFQEKLSGEPSGYYKDQKKSILEDLTTKTN